MRWVLWEDDHDIDGVVDTVMELLRAGIALPPSDSDGRGGTGKRSKRARASVPAKPAKRGARRVRG